MQESGDYKAATVLVGVDPKYSCQESSTGNSCQQHLGKANYKGGSQSRDVLNYCFNSGTGINPKIFQDLVNLSNSEINDKIEYSQSLPVSLGVGQSNKAKSTSSHSINSLDDVDNVLNSFHVKNVPLSAVAVENTTPGPHFLWSNNTEPQAKPAS
ncbi:hypothetical protein DSO57_1030758 [Entomophthora muscae]|uniref:Uncharacterized protein n=1 Tax=Entomophthora muscae TaxID=34485 RepID=A0ACC2T0X7_9FUNG|nr:hypothetical protein DSO57_1030758 [Entomophthora muscae]